MNDATKKIILEEIVPLVTNGEMALFLGAGASIGTPAINGKTIPSTSQLIERICISCGYDKSDYESTDLQTAFGIGQDEIDNFDNFIISNFMCDKPQNWQVNILRVWWRIIFTTNIDDVLDKSLISIKKDTRQYPNYQIFNYLDREPIFRIPTSPEIVKLHGCVNKSSDGFVFDSISYADNTVKQSDWIKNCALHITYGNCIFVGSRFRESDIETAIRQRKTWDNTDNPSKNWIILDNFSKMEEIAYLKRGIIPLQATAEEFFTLLYENIQYISPEKFIKRKAPFLTDANKNSEAIGWFTENLESVRASINHWSTKTGPFNRFYFGDMPDWFYVSHNVPAKFERVSSILRSTINFKNSDEKIHLINIIGPVGSGKTTSALQALTELSKTEPNIYNFNGINGIQVEYLWDVLKDIKGLTVIYIDAAANHYYAVNEILQRAINSPTGCKLCVITEDRTTQHYRNNRHLYQIPHKNIDRIELKNLSNLDAKSLLIKADELGVSYEKLKHLSENEKIEKLINHDIGYKGDLLATLYDLSSGVSYRNKLNDEYNEIENIQARSIYETISLVTACRLPLPLNYLTEVEGVSINSAIEHIKNELNGKVHLKSHSDTLLSVTSRHYSIAEFHLKYCFEKDNIKEHIIKLMQCMSKKFTINDIKKHPISYRIYRNILSYHFLTEQLFTEKNEYALIHDIYSKCQTFFAGDGVFWLQYGRFLEKDGEILEALHCFRRGLDLYDSFQIRHALGHLLLKKYRIDGLKHEEDYREGIAWLDAEINTRGADSFPYTSLISELTKLLNIATHNEIIYDALTKYTTVALNENCFGDPALTKVVSSAFFALNKIKKVKG